MKEPIKVKIIETHEWTKMVEDLGHRIQYSDLQFKDHVIRALINPMEPDIVYVRKSSAEWLLAQ